jgi:hypothetical protein
MSPILGIYASSRLVTPANSYESIATVTVPSSSVTSVSFTSIPSTYQHLQIRAIARTTRTAADQATFRFRLNGDSGNNYSYHRLYGTGSNISGDGGSPYDYSYLYQGATTSDTTNIFGASVWDILDYANTSKNTTVRYFGGFDNNSAGGISLGSGTWFNTAAVSSIDVSIDGGFSIREYSSFALYGIRS